MDSAYVTHFKDGVSMDSAYVTHFSTLEPISIIF